MTPQWPGNRPYLFPEFPETPSFPPGGIPYALPNWQWVSPTPNLIGIFTHELRSRHVQRPEGVRIVCGETSWSNVSFCRWCNGIHWPETSATKETLVSFAVAPKCGAQLTWGAFNTCDYSVHGSGMHCGRVTTCDCPGC